MLIREGGLLLERVGAFEKLFHGGADFDDQRKNEAGFLGESGRTMPRNEYCLAANLASTDGVPVRKCGLA
jgi:myosin-crossreactive antigen